VGHSNLDLHELHELLARMAGLR